jgi:diguanylate cyclase (GGDEF)-like protein/PAS domain S-box-containing protein
MLLLVLAVSVPLVVIVGFAIYVDMQKNIAHTKASLRILANTMVRNSGSKITDARYVLERLASRPMVVRLDPDNCDPILQNLTLLNPGYANAGYTNLQGQVICTAVPRPGGKPVNHGRTEWFLAVLQKKSFNIGRPFLGPLTGKWVSVLSVPIWNARHEMVGVANTPLDLNTFDPNIPSQLLPNGSRYGFFSVDGVMVWRNVDPQNSIGTQPDTEAARQIVHGSDREFVAVASDDVTRFIITVPMPDFGMVAWVGIPANALYAESRQQVVTASIILLVMIIFIYLIAIVIARRITVPVAKLERASRAVRGGDFSVRVAISGPSEIAAVAEEFNATLNTQQRNVEQLRIAATAFESHESMIITDANTVILQVNKAFTESTGYSAEEAVGKTPRLLKSGRHNKNFYQEMWSTLLQTGTWRGEVWDKRKNGEIFPKLLIITAVKNLSGVITHYIGHHIDIAERKAAEEKIHNLAFYDPLTQLPNRRLLMDRLQHALAASARSGHMGALLFIDLDNFKTLNDTLGHETGDLLLKQVAQRLATCVRGGDTVSRLGGDEFVLILENMDDHSMDAASHAENVSDKIKNTLNQIFKLGEHEYKCTSSIGVTLFEGYKYPIEELMKQADIAMYQAKKAGRNAVCFYDQKMQDTILARVLLEGELQKAFDQEQFVLHYQVQVDRSSRSVGVEALVRWQHPARGLIYPEEFIPLAEECGLILPMGHFVLANACQQLANWSTQPEMMHLTMSINVSAKQFHLPIFVEEVLALVEYFGIDPAKLKLEITESMLLDNVDKTIVKMNELKSYGINFSIDDFGTGYSSLQYLKRLPLDQVKIDQSFVRDIATNRNDKVIVKTIIAMAQNMSMEVIAEGVETEEQRLLLVEDGCTLFQGYLFGRPVPIEQLEALLKQEYRN